MRTVGSRRGLGLVVLSLAVLAFQVPASADRRTVTDDTASSDSNADIASISHGHGRSDRILRHEIVFDGDARSAARDVSLFFRFRSWDGDRVERKLDVRRNPDEGLYGAFIAQGRGVTGFTRAWVEDGSTLIVELSRPALGRLRNGRYRWHAWSHLGTGEFDEPCSGEDQGPPVCEDRAPTTGWLVHRLERA